MLFKRAELEAVRKGSLTVAFRRWRRPTVREGGFLKTAVGILSIDRVAVVEASAIQDAEAESAGYEHRSELLAALDSRAEGSIYRIDFHFAGPDPRIALRESDALTEKQLEHLLERLHRLDKFSKRGPWTRRTLLAIEAHPRLAAAELAKHTGHDKGWLKNQIRRLKNLGLTISQQTGYELSPRGIVIVEHLRNGSPAK